MKTKLNSENMLKTLNSMPLEFNHGKIQLKLLKNLLLILHPLTYNFSLLCMVLNMPDKMIEMIP